MVQRLRDPVHDLIEFEDAGLDRIAWQLINSTPFQRLRRIRQLGFSEFVFPGATHTRFSHSVGVFHTARQLCLVLKEKLGDAFCKESAEVAVLGALVHDLGHGPFSHTFEDALGDVGRHELYTAEFIDHPEIFDIINGYNDTYPERIKSLFKKEIVSDIYKSIVSSQFDADRLDYMRRDRLMTGSQLGGIDFTWLMRNLEVAKVPVGVDDQKYADVDTIVLSEKSLWAGEGYVLSLFHLYPAIYLHKTTRGAEKIFGLMLRSLKHLVDERRFEETGLPSNHPLVLYLRNPKISTYALLDDAIVWGALPMLVDSKDPVLAQAAGDLLYRRLWAAVDLRDLRDGAERDGELTRQELKFQRLYDERVQSEQDWAHRVLSDTYKRNPYKRPLFGSANSLEKIHIMKGSEAHDLADVSPVVRALKPFKVNRLYIRRDDKDAREAVHDMIEQAKRG